MVTRLRDLPSINAGLERPALEKPGVARPAIVELPGAPVFHGWQPRHGHRRAVQSPERAQSVFQLSAGRFGQ